MLKILSLILFAEFWNTAGQIFFKKGTNAAGSPSLKTFDAYAAFIRKIIAVPWIWFGLLAMALGLVAWLMALARTDLSIAYPIGSLQYLLTLAAARIFLGEKIDRMKVAGTLLISLGIVLIANG